MAGAMNRLICALALGWLAMPLTLLAATDPTRPPAALMAEENASGAAGEEAGLRLQSVLMPQRGKAVAVISGTTVAVGGMLGTSRLVGLSEREAVLNGPEGVTHLYLTPEVSKQMVVAPGTGRRGNAGHGKEVR